MRFIRITESIQFQQPSIQRSAREELRLTNQTLFTELRGCTAAAGSCPAAATINTRQIVFISPPDVKNSASPRSGIGTTGGVGGNIGQYFDPWGTNYVIRIDGEYNNQVANPYTNNAGAIPNLQLGVIAWSLGADRVGRFGDKNSGTSSRRRHFVAVIFEDCAEHSAVSAQNASQFV